MATLILENPTTGIVKYAPVGFSFTTLFFPSIPCLYRGDFKGFFIQLISDLLGFPIIIWPFIYNKLYVQRLLEKGFKVKDVKGGTLEAVKKTLNINLPPFESPA